MRKQLLFVFCTAIITAAAVVTYVSLATDTTDALCQVLSERISASQATLGKPGSPGYNYYLGHPGELAQARRDTKDLLDSLPC